MPDARAKRPEDRGPTGRNFVSEKKCHLEPSILLEVELTKKEIYTGVPACSVRPVIDVITRDLRSSGL